MTKTKRNNISLFIVLTIMYYLLDYLAFKGYYRLYLSQGLVLCVSHILMTLMLIITMYLALNQFETMIKRDSFLTQIPIIGYLFGLFTFGCTPCLINFLAVFGISYSLTSLNISSLEYKLISLAINLIMIWIAQYLIKTTKCKLKEK